MLSFDTKGIMCEICSFIYEMSFTSIHSYSGMFPGNYARAFIVFKFFMAIVVPFQCITLFTVVFQQALFVPEIADLQFIYVYRYFSLY